jgi:hypothetical protein
LKAGKQQGPVKSFAVKREEYLEIFKKVGQVFQQATFGFKSIHEKLINLKRIAFEIPHANQKRRSNLSCFQKRRFHIQRGKTRLFWQGKKFFPCARLQQLNRLQIAMAEIRLFCWQTHPE